MKTTANSPWLDLNGKLLSDKKLKSISKHWSAEAWERFLAATVESKIPEREVLTSAFEVLCNEQQDSLWGTPCSLPETVQGEIHSAIKKLEERPRKIIRLYYWENKSTREIARIENLSPSRVQEIKKDSLNQIKHLLKNALHTSSYLIGR